MTIKEILDDPSVHNFTKSIIKAGLKKDCLDAYYDVLLAAKALKTHMDKCL